MAQTRREKVMPLETVIDGLGEPITVIMPGQGAPTDRSGTIAVDLTSQQLFPANATRSGFLVQNQSMFGNLMRVSELGADAALLGAWVLRAFEYFPPHGVYDIIPVGIFTISGSFGDPYAAREW
jgi:hypothetical protein